MRIDIIILKTFKYNFFSFLILQLVLSSQMYNHIYANTIQDSILETLTNKLGTHKQFSAKFTQSRYMKMFKKPLISTGTISFSYPDKILFHYVTPFESFILLTDGTMKRYRIENGRPVKQTSLEIVAKIITKEIIRFLGGGLKNGGPYEIKYDSSKPNQLSLIPQSSMAQTVFSLIELIFSKDKTYIKQIKLIEKNGDYIHIQHKSPSFDPLPDSLFHVPN